MPRKSSSIATTMRRRDDSTGAAGERARTPAVRMPPASPERRPTASAGPRNRLRTFPHSGRASPDAAGMPPSDHGGYPQSKEVPMSAIQERPVRFDPKTGTYRAAVVHDFDEPLVVEDVPRLALEPGQI